MAQGSGTRSASQEECREAAIMNSGPQRQVYVSEQKAERLLDMKRFDPPKPRLLRAANDLPDKAPF